MLITEKIESRVANRPKARSPASLDNGIVILGESKRVEASLTSRPESFF